MSPGIGESKLDWDENAEDVEEDMKEDVDDDSEDPDVPIEFLRFRNWLGLAMLQIYLWGWRIFLEDVKIVN